MSASALLVVWTFVGVSGLPAVPAQGEDVPWKRLRIRADPFSIEVPANWNEDPPPYPEVDLFLKYRGTKKKVTLLLIQARTLNRSPAEWIQYWKEIQYPSLYAGHRLVEEKGFESKSGPGGQMFRLAGMTDAYEGYELLDGLLFSEEHVVIVSLLFEQGRHEAYRPLFEHMLGSVRPEAAGSVYQLPPEPYAIATVHADRGNGFFVQIPATQSSAEEQVERTAPDTYDLPRIGRLTLYAGKIRGSLVKMTTSRFPDPGAAAAGRQGRRTKVQHWGEDTFGPTTVGGHPGEMLIVQGVEDAPWLVCYRAELEGCGYFIHLEFAAQVKDEALNVADRIATAGSLIVPPASLDAFIEEKAQGLGEAVARGDARGVSSALGSMAFLGPEPGAVAAVVRLLDAPAQGIIRLGIEGLGRMRSRLALEALGDAYRGTGFRDDAKMRTAVLHAADACSAESRDLLLEAVEDPEPEVAVSAIELLAGARTDRRHVTVELRKIRDRMRRNVKRGKAEPAVATLVLPALEGALARLDG